MPCEWCVVSGCRQASRSRTSRVRVLRYRHNVLVNAQEANSCMRNVLVGGLRTRAVCVVQHSLKYRLSIESLAPDALLCMAYFQEEEGGLLGLRHVRPDRGQVRCEELAFFLVSTASHFVHSYRRPTMNTMYLLAEELHPTHAFLVDLHRA